MYHVPFPVVARVAFGMWGCIPAILVRTFVALMVSLLSIYRLIVSGLLLPQSKVEDISRTWSRPFGLLTTIFRINFQQAQTLLVEPF